MDHNNPQVNIFPNLLKLGKSHHFLFTLVYTVQIPPTKETSSSESSRDTQNALTAMDGDGNPSPLQSTR